MFNILDRLSASTILNVLIIVIVVCIAVAFIAFILQRITDEIKYTYILAFALFIACVCALLCIPAIFVDTMGELIAMGS